MGTPEDLTVLTGLLDFYSDRATAHASFVVAGTFGIYALLFAQKDIRLPSSVFCPVFLALVAISIYSFLNFGFYATMAEAVRVRLMGSQAEKIDTEIKNALNKASKMFDTFRWIKDKPFHGKMRYVGFLLIWFLAVIVPFIWMLLHYT